MNEKNVPFPLRPIKTATVSVISEATAAANIPANEKINFHIGNPLQDERLTKSYFEICTGYSTDIFNGTPEGSTELSETDLGKLSFIYKTITDAIPYTPRGGFSVQNLPGIIKQLQKWLKEQEEALIYSLGETTEREVIISNGGVEEFLRIFFTVVETFCINLPAKVVTFNFNLSQFTSDFKSIEVIKNFEGSFSSADLQQILSGVGHQSILFLIGKILSEKERSTLKKLTSGLNILFCELIDLKNHQSLAKESGLKESVIRFLSAGIFNPALKNCATQFVLGNSELLKLYAAIHFELKGTPSATERNWLEYTLQKQSIQSEIQNTQQENDSEYPVLSSQKVIDSVTSQINSISAKVSQLAEIVNKTANKYNKTGLQTLQHLNRNLNPAQYYDELEFKPLTSLIPSALREPDTITQSFLNHFVKHHTQYNINNCFAVSGSARTALSLLGKHCGIQEAVTFDWSWTYENNFYHVDSVPLLNGGVLNSAGLLERIRSKINSNPDWKQKGAVVLNNPHNASGRVFPEAVLKSLLTDLLEQDIIVIDDLSYQNVAPSREPLKIKTLKELANESVKNGMLRSQKINNLITAHSLSKTDCFAGARLTVVEVSHPVLQERFKTINSHVLPNTMAILLAYLFYRNDPVTLKKFWRLRNWIFAERIENIKKTVEELPVELNPFQIDIRAPEGSMYPQMVIENFPQGISIDNISTRLSHHGIGIIPLTAFSKTAEGYENGRKTFRLTLGGTDHAEILGKKTRRLLIELNRLLHEESRDYQLLKLKTEKTGKIAPYFSSTVQSWNSIISNVEQSALKNFNTIAETIQSTGQQSSFEQEYLPWRIAVLNQRFNELMALYSKVIDKTQHTDPKEIAGNLAKEFYKENIEDRQHSFKNRLFDRTVHPTQMYSLGVDTMIEKVFSALVYNPVKSIDSAAIGREIVKEFLGINIPINSEQEAFELIFDLRMMIRNELYTDNQSEYILSFWGDWDGSTRPSGQGHRLVAAVLIENVRHMAYFLKTIGGLLPDLPVETSLKNELDTLRINSKQFWALLNKITSLTNQLEKSYKGLLPTAVQAGRFRQAAIKLKLRRDPLKVLFSHNNRLEKKMMRLRRQRKRSLEYYFELNKKLRKKLYELIPIIVTNTHNPKIALLAGGYKNLLRRFVLTPRIHQKTITAADPFAIENTVHNLCEINQIGSHYGDPGIIMALQISMATNSDAFIDLNRMITRKKEALNKEYPGHPIKDIWLIPLFEDQDTLSDLASYLNKIWHFADNSRSIKQSVNERFKEIICEIFVAGSDLSQQVGQPKSWELFKKTKAFFYQWLAQKNLINEIRIKLGCGEPMQRQGGYYSDISGKSILFNPELLENKTITRLSPPAQKSMLYASSPLTGLHLGSDLRTLQSNAAEHIFRFINFEDRSQLFHHMEILQNIHKRDLDRARKIFTNTRRDLKEKGVNEIKRISRLTDSIIFQDFVNNNTESFRQIVYGQDEDVVGIHVISYFISRMVPVFRDRPTVRPAKEGSQNARQKIVERIAHTLPMAHHGSLLRAIGHNRAQSVLLGVSQVSTGLFRTLKILQEQYPGPNTIPHILSNLSIKEILYDLRVYQQTDLKYIKKLEPAFNNGNSALRALYEDFEYMYEFIPYLQQALIAKKGLAPSEFFVDNKFKQELLPYFRPDLAVLLQNNLFNTHIDDLGLDIKYIDKKWLQQTKNFLELPNRLSEWREKIWNLIETKIFQQVSSFIDLAMALTILSKKTENNDGSIELISPKSSRLANQVNTLLRGRADDSMRYLLYSVVEYISHLPQDSTQLPIDTVRALHDIEGILKIDAQPLSEKEQSKLRFYILKMARLTHENG